MTRNWTDKLDDDMNTKTDGISSGLVAVAKIDRDEEMNRLYIPVCDKWEIQTKGKGSSFRIARRDNSGERWLVCDEHLHNMLEEMATDIHKHISDAEAIIADLNNLVIAVEALGFANREIERLTKSESDWIACHARIFRELQDTKTVVGNQAERIAELEASPISEEVIDILRSRIAKQSAALKLARPFVQTATYSFIDGSKAKEALAAIDALGE